MIFKYESNLNFSHLLNTLSCGILVMCIFYLIKDTCFVILTLCSTGEVIPVVNKEEFIHQKEMTSAHSDSTSVMISKSNSEVDNEVADKTLIDNDSSSSGNSTFIVAEDNTEIVQVKPMESLIVSNNTQSHSIVNSSKKGVQDNSVGSVSDQSILTQSHEEMSETITHSTTQLEITGMIL